MLQVPVSFTRKPGMLLQMPGGSHAASVRRPSRCKCPGADMLEVPKAVMLQVPDVPLRRLP